MGAIICALQILAHILMKLLNSNDAMILLTEFSLHRNRTKEIAEDLRLKSGSRN